LSRSALADLINKTPAHVKYSHPRLNPFYVQPEDRDVFSIGTAAHSLFLEGIDCCAVIEASDWRSKDAKAARDDARAAGKTPLLKKDYDKVQAMVDAAHEQLAASELGIKDLHSEGDSELSYIWKEENGSYCRVRPDWISNDKIANGGKSKLIIDYKTSESADPNVFAKKVVQFGYDIQENFYPRGVQSVEGGELPFFIFMIQETVEPFLCSFINLMPQWREIGSSKVDYGLFLWNQCIRSGNWPGYDKRVATVDCPPWVAAQWEAIATNIGISED
jgi:hypothetical protein